MIYFNITIYLTLKTFFFKSCDIMPKIKYIQTLIKVGIYRQICLLTGTKMIMFGIYNSCKTFKKKSELHLKLTILE